MHDEKNLMNFIIRFKSSEWTTFIRAYKWTELQVLKLFTPWLRSFAKRTLEKIGIVLHCPGDPEWSEIDNERVLTKCSKYDKIIHLNIHDDNVFALVANAGMSGFSEAYLNKMWDICGSEENIAQLCKRVLENNLMDMYYYWWNTFLEWLELYAFNLQTRKRAFQVGVVHYDLGNSLFERMLDPWLQYTCGYWKETTDLNTAQINKMDLIARKLDLQPGMRVLDIGCGWGTLCKYLAENYHVECVGVTIGEEGAKYGKNICKGLPVDIRVQDYREITEQFDRIVSVGMFEHVGFHNYQEYFKVARRCLKDDGIFLLHTIARDHNYKFPGRSEPFIHKHIFPNGNLPNLGDIAKAIDKQFVIEDLHNFGQDYAKTLFAWRENFVKGWAELQNEYDERFYRMWVLYLCIGRAGFSARRLNLWQIVLSKEGLQREYRAAR